MKYYRKKTITLIALALQVLVIFVLTNYVQKPTTQSESTPTTVSENTSITPEPQVAGEQTGDENTYLVTKVIDGDTIEIEGGQKVRYIGINAPEVNKKQCYSKEATDKNKNLVLNKRVQLIKDVSETDKYGRLLRYVYVNDIFVNNTMVREGYASAMTYPPDVKFAQQFKRAEEEARNQNKGLWGGCKR